MNFDLLTSLHAWKTLTFHLLTFPACLDDDDLRLPLQGVDAAQLADQIFDGPGPSLVNVHQPLVLCTVTYNCQDQTVTVSVVLLVQEPLQNFCHALQNAIIWDRIIWQIKKWVRGTLSPPFFTKMSLLPPASEGWGKVIFSVCSHLCEGWISPSRSVPDMNYNFLKLCWCKEK